MRPTIRTLAAAIAFSLCLGATAHAKKAPETTEAASLQRGVIAAESGVIKADGRYSADGAAMALYKSDFRAQRDTPEKMAREFLTAECGKFGLSEAEIADLSVVNLREGNDFSVVRLHQFKQGLPIYGSDLAVSVTPDGKIIYVANATVRKVGAVDTSKALRTSAQALETARNYLGTAGLRDQESEQMIFLGADGKSRVVWRINASPVDKHSYWQLLVDAETGEVLRAEDIALYADGTGTVFYPDPLSSNRVAYNNATGYGDSPNGGAANSDSPQLTASLVPVALRDITLTGSNYSLVGPWADCREMDTPADGACPSQPSTAFNFTRSNLYFDAVMVYYHIDTYMRYINETLGIPIRPTAYATGVRFDPHGFQGADNSNYVGGSTQRLSFGQGGVDDAQDPDVIIHELGHGLHHWFSGGTSQVEGLSEGFGDYVASGYSRDFPNQWTPADTAYYWMFNWDGHNSFWAGRVTNWQLTHSYPSNLGTPAPHTPGQYWASCNLVARDLIGGIAMDTAYFKGMSMTGSSTNQKDAAQAISNAATAMNYNNAQMTALNYAYNAGTANGNTGCTYAVTVVIPPLVDAIFNHGFDSAPL